MDFCPGIQAVQPVFQALLRLKGWGEEALGNVHVLHKPIGSAEFALDIEASAEHTARFQHAACLPERGVLVGRGVKPVLREDDIELPVLGMMSDQRTNLSENQRKRRKEERK